MKGGGSTNKEKKRKKNFLMIKESRSVRDKVRKSLKAQQRDLKQRVKVLSKSAKKTKRGRR